MFNRRYCFSLLIDNNFRRVYISLFYEQANTCLLFNPQGAIEILTEDESVGSLGLNLQEDKRHTPSMEEMEVKVDPMLFLQCGMEQSASEASDSSDNEEEITRTHSPGPLPLTKKYIYMYAKVFNMYYMVNGDFTTVDYSRNIALIFEVICLM